MLLFFQHTHTHSIQKKITHESKTNSNLYLDGKFNNRKADEKFIRKWRKKTIATSVFLSSSQLLIFLN